MFVRVHNSLAVNELFNLIARHPPSSQTYTDHRPVMRFMRWRQFFFVCKYLSLIVINVMCYQSMHTGRVPAAFCCFVSVAVWSTGLVVVYYNYYLRAVGRKVL